MRRPAPGALLALALALPSCRGAEAPVRVAPGTPVVLITIDTLRSDRLPAYGYRGVETPALDALRREAILFERAYAHTPLTLPSHASLLTGLLPGEHGVRDNVGYALDPRRVESGELPYLPLLLRERGYATGAAVSAFVLQGKTGLRAGFDFYEDSIELRSGAGLGGLQRPGGETLRLALPWLREAAARPFFLFFHLYEPHTPYAPPAPFAGRFADPYDGEIAAADAVVGELAAELRRLGVWDRALVVLTSDHGEGLGEHGEEEHGLLLHREAIQVPLLLKLPDGRSGGSSAAAPVQLIDVAPTVAGLLGLPPPPSWSGASLLDLLAPEAPWRDVYSETFYPRLHFGWSDLASLVDGRRHLIEGPAAELYDLVADPRERRDILREERRTYAEMKRRLERFRRPLAPPSAIDEETRKAMAALGYLGSVGRPAEGPLPDPKAQLPSLAELKRGFQLMHEKRWGEAERTFAGIVEANPRMVDAWEFLGRCRLKLDRPEAALAAYEEALRRSGGAPHVAQSVASILFDLGRLDEAAAHARLAESSVPSFAHGMTARIELRRGDLGAAERSARLAMEGASERILPRLTLAEVLHARGELEAALATVGEAKRLYAERQFQDPDLVFGLHLLEGRILADLGRVEPAAAAFREEIRRFPEHVQAWASLALLQALAGRPQDAARTLRGMTETNPTAAAYAEAVRTYRALGDERGAGVVLRHALARFPDSRELRALAAGA